MLIKRSLMSILTLSGETQSGVIWSKNGIKKINIIYYNPINGDVICFDEYTDSYTHINGQIYKFPPSNYNFITNISGTTEDLFESMIGLNGIIKKSDCKNKTS